VCSDALRITELGCPTCATRLSGLFSTCRFCRLDDTDLEALVVFLKSRGNLREFQQHLGVSYPTARVRYAELMERLGLGEPADAPLDREQILRDVAAGRLSVDDAEALLTDDEV
jgi:hypothetical protein